MALPNPLNLKDARIKRLGEFLSLRCRSVVRIVDLIRLTDLSRRWSVREDTLQNSLEVTVNASNH
jgi:hypothetical protein